MANLVERKAHIAALRVVATPHTLLLLSRLVTAGKARLLTPCHQAPSSHIKPRQVSFKGGERSSGTRSSCMIHAQGSQSLSGT